MENEMKAYLDNAATTKVLNRVKDVMVKVMCEDFGNPSAMHIKGVEAEQYIKKAKEQIARALRAEEKEIFFTSGGTESNNMALIGAARANRRRGDHIITTAVEHPSVEEPLRYLEKEGFRITRISVDSDGKISPKDVKEALCEKTILVSTMLVNNEIGAIEPVEETVRLVKREKPDVLYHVDAIQGFGKYIFYPKTAGVDLMSVSGHKIHGPKGIGFLYVRQGTKIEPILFGGGQQKGMRSGTENVPAIAGLGEAVQEICGNLAEHLNNLYKQKEYFVEELSKIEGVHLNGLTGKESAPHIVSARFDGVRSEVLLHGLEDRGIYVSAGSACSSNHKSAISSTLKEIGINSDYLKNNGVLRFSFSIFTTKEELSYTIKTLNELLPVLRRYARK